MCHRVSKYNPENFANKELGYKETMMGFEKHQYFLWAWWKSIGFGSLKMHIEIVYNRKFC